MSRPELTHDYLKTLRALCMAVVKDRRANPGSPDAPHTDKGDRTMREVITRARAKMPWLAEITPQKENEPEQWGAERSLPDRDRSIPGDFPCRGTRNLNHTERRGRSLVLLTGNDTGFWCSGAREGPSWPSFRPGNWPNEQSSGLSRHRAHRVGARPRIRTNHGALYVIATSLTEIPHGRAPRYRPAISRGWRTPGRGPRCFGLTPRPGTTAVSPPRQPLGQSLDPPDIRDLAAHLARDVGKCVSAREELPDAPPFDFAERTRRALRSGIACLRRDVGARRRVLAPEPERAGLGHDAGAGAPEALSDLREHHALAVQLPERRDLLLSPALIFPDVASAPGDPQQLHAAADGRFRTPDPLPDLTGAGAGIGQTPEEVILGVRPVLASAAHAFPVVFHK